MKNLKIDYLLVGVLVLEVLAVGFLLHKAVYSRVNLIVGPVITDVVQIISESLSVENSTTTILVFGDMMLDRNVRQKINQFGADYPFALIKDFLVGKDVVVVNAEGPFTANPSKTLGVHNGPLTFTFDPAVLPMLKNLGFTLLGQANNHTLNFGTAGLKESESNIDQAGINWFGDPSNKDLHSFVTTINGEKIAFVGYHQFASNGLENVVNEIKNLKDQGAFVTVYPHWGEEYVQDKTDFQVRLAHIFVDAGADAVIGSHPHVVEPIEIYKNKIIFYSLGNFIFDQASSGPTSEGLSVEISITPTDVSYNLFPINIRQNQASVMMSVDRTKLLNNLAKKSSGGVQFKADIINGVIALDR